VFIARGALDRAERDAALGAEAQRRGRHDMTPLPAAGLHWLRGMLLGARGEIDAALASFDEEIATGQSGHIYARECALNARVATGFTQLSQGNASAAAAVFRDVLGESSDNARASVGLYAALRRTGDSGGADRMQMVSDGAIATLASSDRPGEAALARAGQEIARGRMDEAVGVLVRLLSEAPPGPTGWMIPVDPMLADLHLAKEQPALLATLAARAA
jgi:tetratricopeptide (TPR) repeat protein